MNKDLATTYLNFGNEKFRIKRSTPFKLLLLNLILFAVAPIPYQFNYVNILCGVIFGLNFLVFLFLFIKGSLYNSYLLFTIEIIFSIIAMNIIYFSIAKFSDCFNIIEFSISVTIQILMIFPSFLLIKIGEKYILNNKISKTYVWTGSISGFFAVIGYILGKYFFVTLSDKAGIIIFLIVTNIIAFGLLIICTGFAYKSYLIKKYEIQTLSKKNI